MDNSTNSEITSLLIHSMEYQDDDMNYDDYYATCDSMKCHHSDYNRMHNRKVICCRSLLSKRDVIKIIDEIDDSVTNLQFLNCNLSRKSINYLCNFIMRKNTLTYLNISTQINFCSIKKICNLLKEDINLQNLNITISDNKYNESIAEIAEALKINTKLHSLRIYNHNKQFNHKIVDVLKINTTLTDLNIYFNKIGGNDMNYIVDMLKINTTLKSLNIANCNIDNDGIIKIAKLLEQNISLEKLYIGQNDFDNVGIQYIINSLAFNTNLKKLDILLFKFNNDSIVALANILKINNTLESLKFNIVRPHGSLYTVIPNSFLEIANSLKINYGLKNLFVMNIYEYDFDRAVYEHFIDFLNYNYTLEECNFLDSKLLSKEQRELKMRFLKTKKSNRIEN